MPRRDPQTICEALAEVKKFFIYFGNSDCTRIALLERLIQRFQEERLTNEMVAELVRFKDETYIQTREQIWGGRCLPGPHETKEKTEAEFSRVFAMLTDALYPPEPEWPRLDVSGFAGSDYVKTRDTAYRGDPAAVRSVFERSVAMVCRHTEAVSRGDFQSAYDDAGADLKAWMSLKKFETTHKEASSRYGGSPMEFQIDGFAFVLADEQARKKSTKDEGWPKTTPKETRRAKLTGFWIRDGERHGCHGSFWITEESGEYRIAKFDFWTM
jgi:hypothetical protein